MEGSSLSPFWAAGQMFPRCTFADTRSNLNEAMKKDGSLKYQRTLLELSKFQRQFGTLDLLKLGTLIHDKFELEEDDCSSVKVVGRPCTNDIKGLFSDLVWLLASSSQFIRHSAARALLVLLHRLEEIPFLWIFFMNELFSSLMVFFDNGEETGETEPSPKVLEDSLISSEQKCFNRQRNQDYLACVLQLLHDSFRSCKHEGELKLRMFLMIFEPFSGNFLASFKSHFLQNIDEDKNEEKDLALGVVLRLLCSVTHCISVHSNVVERDKWSQILESINGFVSTFSNYCLSGGNFLPHYLQHKFLLLLLRLCEWFVEFPFLGLTCKSVLEPHLGALCGSLFMRKGEANGGIFSSPFAYCLVLKEQKQGSSSSVHPEKYAVFLMFKVVVSSKIASCCDKSNVSIANGDDNDQGEKWLFCWLLSQINLMVELSTIRTFEIADFFTCSFLEIFVDEDTLLLDILLLLLDVSSLQIFQGLIQTHDKASQASQALVIEIFKPVRLFAVFISLVSYDHSVLLDFLISKDIGVRCLQYLVRSIRIVNNTWPEFLSLSSPESIREDVDCNMDVANGMEKPQLPRRNLYIEEVANCLSALKSAIERLHRKKAFPYNPSPLLKLLNSFEQLWHRMKA